MLWGNQVRAHALGVTLEEQEERDAAVRHYQAVAEEWRSRYHAAERVIRTMSERSTQERGQLAVLAEQRAAAEQLHTHPTLGPGWWFAAGATASGLVALALFFSR